MTDYMLNNRLKSNDNKPHLMVMTTCQFRTKNPTLQVEIRTPTETISESKSEKLSSPEYEMDRAHFEWRRIFGESNDHEAGSSEERG